MVVQILAPEVVRDEQVGPAVLVVIGPRRREAEAVIALVQAHVGGRLDEAAVAVVAEEHARGAVARVVVGRGRAGLVLAHPDEVPVRAQVEVEEAVLVIVGERTRGESSLQAVLEPEGGRVAREAALAVVDEQHRARSGEEDQVLVAVVVHVGEERLRRALEHGDAGRVGHVRERAVAIVAEEPVRQAFGLADVDVVEAVAVEVADRQPLVPHAAARHEEPVEARGPLLLSRDELAPERGVPAESRLGLLAEDRLRRAAAQVRQDRPLRDAPGGVGAAPPAHLPAADTLGHSSAPGRADEVEAHGRADERVRPPRHLDRRDQELGCLKRLEVGDECFELSLEGATVADRLRREGAGTEDLELRARAERDLVGGSETAALELGGEERLHGVTRAGRALAQARAQLSEPDREFLGFLLLGKGVASGREVLLRCQERGRHAPLRVIAIDLRRRRLGPGDGGGPAARLEQHQERETGGHGWTASGVRGRPPRAVPKILTRRGAGDQPPFESRPIERA